MGQETKNIAASVHQRLLSKARDFGRPFNAVLQYFALERFVYRHSKSPSAERCILKGALMFTAWQAPVSRPTKDIDLLGRIDNSIDVITAVKKESCMQKVEPDGMAFDAESVTVETITEKADYEGGRVRIQGNLGNAHISLQIKFGFGDVVVPGASKIIYPTILDFPPPELNSYNLENTMAAPASFAEAVSAITAFLEPVIAALVAEEYFHKTWKALGPWRQTASHIRCSVIYAAKGLDERDAGVLSA